jgi:hypothetical protein
LKHGLYARGNSDTRLLVGVYADDLIIIGGCTKVINTFKGQMMAQFKMSGIGPLSFYLDIEVHQNRGVITLSQGSYAAKIIDRAGLTRCNPMCYTHGDKI